MQNEDRGKNNKGAQQIVNTASDKIEMITGLLKSPTGIKGLDEILGGGLPQGRVSLVCGGPGSGKTLLATEFLVNGAVQYNEPGVFMVFEETAEDLVKNSTSLGIDLEDLTNRKLILIDYVYVERSEIEETGEYDLEGLFIRLDSAIQAIGAKRVVLDTIESIFAGFQSEAILRSEIRRLFRWLKDKGVTTIVTGEQGEKSLSRYGLEEYVSDCVILMQNRVQNKMANRLLRVVKYRGSHHGSDEYPFLIGNKGIWVEPITSAGLSHRAMTEAISTGVPQLDEMLTKGGYYRGSSILVSGSAGTGKSSLAASLLDAACARGERSLYVAFEESTSQIIRNMQSIGIDLGRWQGEGLLRFYTVRPTFYSLEMHLLLIEEIIEEHQPLVMVMDPISDMNLMGTDTEIKTMLVRLIDYLKSRRITALFTNLMSEGQEAFAKESGTSSLMDTWILLRNIENNGERNRCLYILKSRGQSHSNQVREYVLTDHGIELVDVYLGPEGIITGSAREEQKIRDRVAEQKRKDAQEVKRNEMLRKKQALINQIQIMQDEIDSLEPIFNQEVSDTQIEQAYLDNLRQSGAASRQSAVGSSSLPTTVSGENS